MERGRRNVEHKPPFPYFGGKSAVASDVWRALGNVRNYVEPFCGSAAMLFLRPDGPGEVETINDADGLLSNFWRAMRFDPDAVAEWADYPIDECMLHARHLRLVGIREELTARLQGDPDYYDARAAGEWCWGLACWIGGGWCSGEGPWFARDGKMVLGERGGVKRQLPDLGSTGRGVKRQLPHLGTTGVGVNRQLPDLGSTGRGECEERRAWLIGYLRGISDRLRNVRVCCGDWNRVCGKSVTITHGLTGVFLDPPYADTAGRDPNIYAVDCLQVAHDVCEWAIEWGDHPQMRIVLAGYEGEHVMPDTWRVIEWTAFGGYANQSGNEDSNGKLNRKRERLWCSPHCVPEKSRMLF